MTELEQECLFIPDHKPLLRAVYDIRSLINGVSGLELGVVVVAIDEDVTLWRLSNETTHRLRLQIHGHLNGILRKDDRLYNTNALEWLFVLPKLRSSAVLTLAMLKIRETLGDSLPVNGINIPIRWRCGAAISSDEKEDPLYLIQSARIARLHCGDNQLGSAIYDTAMEGASEQRCGLRDDLMSAFSGKGDLQLFLQPKVEAATGRCIGAEALLRWRRDNGQWQPAEDTFAAIEQFGLREHFNVWLFSTSARVCAQLSDSCGPISLSINLSANDLLDLGVPELLRQTLDVWGVSASSITVEITETAMLGNLDIISNVLYRFRDIGVKLSIDDFGTGYSGMSHLQALPVDEVKIDKRFINDITGSTRDREITASIIELSHRLGVAVVAEGVESHDTAELLAAMRCDYLQGFHFSKAIPVDEFVVWYMERQIHR